MKNFLLSVTNFIREEEGASAVEYGILVAAIAAVIIATTIIIGGQINTAFTNVCDKLAAVVSGVTCTPPAE